MSSTCTSHKPHSLTDIQPQFIQHEPLIVSENQVLAVFWELALLLCESIWGGWAMHAASAHFRWFILALSLTVSSDCVIWHTSVTQTSHLLIHFKLHAVVITGSDSELTATGGKHSEVLGFDAGSIVFVSLVRSSVSSRSWDTFQTGYNSSLAVIFLETPLLDVHLIESILCDARLNHQHLMDPQCSIQ